MFLHNMGGLFFIFFIQFRFIYITSYIFRARLKVISSVVQEEVLTSWRFLKTFKRDLPFITIN